MTSALPGSGGAADRPVEAGLYRRRARNGRHARSISRRSCARTITVALNLQTRAARSRPDPPPVLRLWASLNWDGYCNPEVDGLIEQQSTRGRPGAAQASWSGRSSASWRRTSPGRSSFIDAVAHLLAALCQGADDRWSTASSTAGAWKTSGSTNKATEENAHEIDTAIAAVAASALLIAISAGGTASAQKPGGILRMYSLDSPASMSILEEANALRQRTDDGGVQQPGHVRPACGAEQPANRSCPIWRPAGRGTRTGPS